MAKANLIHVPYKGGGPAMSDLLGGQIPSVFASATTAVPQVKAGKLRALGTTGAKRSATMPDVPTIAEQGYPGTKRPTGTRSWRRRGRRRTSSRG